MDLNGLKLQQLGIEKSTFGRIFAFIDYGNVNCWFDKDRNDGEGSPIPENQKLIIDIQKLYDFLKMFCDENRFYYGHNPRRKDSLHLVIKAERCGFKKITKPMQFIRHILTETESESLSESTAVMVGKDGRKYLEIPKSNFDVEISVDSIRRMDDYDTICLLSGDSDFAHLANYLKRKGKKVIIISSGEVFHTLKKQMDLYINAQRIKRDITTLKTIST